MVINQLAGNLSTDGCEVNTLDFHKDPLPLFNPDTVWEQDFYPELKRKVVAADVIVLGTPDYHGSISSTLKNFLDHFWKEFTGKLFATVVASHEKGLTVHDQLRTVARQCYAWVMPYGVSFLEKVDVKDGEIASDELRNRLEMLQKDLQIYGKLLASQRAADLAGTAPGFLAQLRK
jgi:FMN reductase